MTNEEIIEEIAHKAYRKGFYKEFMEGINRIPKHHVIKDSSERCDLYYKVYYKVKSQCGTNYNKR